METGALLLMKEISKSYDGTKALQAVDFSADRGEVHAIVGENGAGKSTLVKILTGAVKADSGMILLAGKPVKIPNPHRAQLMGIRAVHQHFSLIPHLSVTENILLGHLPRSRFGRFINWSEAHRRAAQILQEIGFEDIEVRRPLSGLSCSQQQIVEIAKAMAIKPRLLILDEPSAVLSHKELMHLFDLIRRLKKDQASILYISHRLDEVFEIADRVTVLKDGRLVGTVRPQETTKGKLIEMMVGRPLEEVFTRPRTTPGAELLRVNRLSREGFFQDVSFSLARGEVVGFYGLVGSGRTEMARCLFGADQPTGGDIWVEGRKLQFKSPREALNAGITMLTEDRIKDGLVMFMSIGDNISLPNHRLMSSWGILRRRRQRELVKKVIQELGVRPPDPERLINTLSGGNQQKVVLAKWLTVGGKILILDEPTRGVDVATKQEIYNIIGRLAAKGMGILLISSELPEILGISDRALVMREGRLARAFSQEEATEPKLLACAAGIDK